METLAKTKVTVETTVNVPVEKAWEFWTDTKHVIHWNNASDDWHTPHAINDFRVGGRFSYRMEARDGSSGFNFSGEYNNIELFKHIEFTLGDNRRVWIIFSPKGAGTRVAETFEAEQEHSVVMQEKGWQSILDNFKKYAESHIHSERLHFEFEVAAEINKVFKTMFDEKGFREWTSEFNASSHFKGSWEKGSKMLFLGHDKDGNLEGMVSRIRENIPGKFMSIEHLGIVHNDQEITEGPEAEKWKGFENYTFRTEKGKTIVSIDADTNMEMKDYFLEIWPKAINRLKTICEKH
jgi:uncharacterized protein YndB with AHSA1/START domain